MLRSLYDRLLALAASPRAPAWLAAISFAESSFFPVMPDLMLAPMVFSRPQKAYLYAAICTLASVAGGVLGYAIGYFLEPLGRWILEISGQAGGLTAYQAWYAKWGVWVILAKGLTPIPYKLVTIASGLAAFNFPMFIAASIVTRGARFFVVAALVKRFGPAIQPVIERRLALVLGVLVALAVLGLVAAHLLGKG